MEVSLVGALQQIKVSTDIIEWTRQQLLSASKVEQTDRTTQISNLTKRYGELDRHISMAYDHHIQGKIDETMWQAKTNQWKQEKIEIQQQLDTLELDNDRFMDEGIRLMEIASKASTLFESMTPDEKREITHLVLSNFQKENLFTNVTDLEKWRSERDSNPRPSA